MNRVFRGLLVTLLLFSLIGCNGNSSGDNETKDLDKLEKKTDNETLFELFEAENADYLVAFQDGKGEFSQYFNMDGTCYNNIDNEIQETCSSATVKPLFTYIFINTDIGYMGAAYGEDGSMRIYTYSDYSGEFFKSIDENSPKMREAFYDFLLHIGTNKIGYMYYLNWVYENKVDWIIDAYFKSYSNIPKH